MLTAIIDGLSSAIFNNGLLFAIIGGTSASVSAPSTIGSCLLLSVNSGSYAIAVSSNSFLSPIADGISSAFAISNSDLCSLVLVVLVLCLLFLVIVFCTLLLIILVLHLLFLVVVFFLLLLIIIFCFLLLVVCLCLLIHRFHLCLVFRFVHVILFGLFDYFTY